MDTLIRTAAVVTPLVGAVIVPSLFFMFVGWLGRRGQVRVRRVLLTRLLNEQTPADVYRRGGVIVRCVTEIATPSISENRGLPFPMQDLIILRSADGSSTIVPARTVLRIVTLASEHAT